MTTLPTCTIPDCTACITHWHGDDGDLYACLSALNGRPCPHGDQDNRCYAPREASPTSPLHLPDVDTVARAIYESEYDANWDDEDGRSKDAYRRNARAILDLIAAHHPVWRDIDPADIKVGMRVKISDWPDAYTVFTVAAVGPHGVDGADGWFEAFAGYPDGSWQVDTSTVPAPTLTERIRAALNDSPESIITLDVADVEALLDAMGGEDK